MLPVSEVRGVHTQGCRIIPPQMQGIDRLKTA